MTLAELVHEVGELRAPSGDTLASDCRKFINRAQRTIAGRKNWSFLFSRESVTIDAGGSSVQLPSTFKELAAEKNPISFNHPSTNMPVPVTLSSRAELERGLDRRLLTIVPIPSQLYPVHYVFLEQSGPGGSYTLNLSPYQTADVALTFNLSAYWYPAELAKGSDRNHLTDDPELADALVNLAKHIAYTSIDPTDKRADACFAIYERRVHIASVNDSRKKFAGRSMRM